MSLILSKPFAPSTSDPWDVRQIKKILNRLGYYTPLETTGITDIPDRAVFVALRQFQADQGLPITGEARPDDKTVQLLSSEAEKTPSGYYKWRTVDDSRVRKTHAQYANTVRAWADSPDPGEDYNCRCWAEPVKEIVIPQNVSEEVRDAFEEVKGKLQGFDNEKYILAARLLRHYIDRSGTSVTLLPEAMDNSIMVKEAISTNQKRFEDSLIKGEVNGEYSTFKDRILKLRDKQKIILDDYWDVDVKKSWAEFKGDHDFARTIGSVKVRSKAEIDITRDKNKIILNGKVVHSFDDTYDFNGDDNIVNEIMFKNQRLLVKEGFAKIFKVHWEKSQQMTGVINIDENGDIQNHSIIWKNSRH